MGIPAYVLRRAANNADPITSMDCTNDGWSARFTEVTVVNAEGPFNPTADRPGVLIVRHRTVHALHAVSVEDKESNRWTMAGGNFLHSSDSRFGELCTKLLREGGMMLKPLNHFGYGAVSIHDRIEY